MSISCPFNSKNCRPRTFFQKKLTDPIIGKQYQILSSATKAILIIDVETGTINQNGNRMHTWLKQKTNCGKHYMQLSVAHTRCNRSCG